MISSAPRRRWASGSGRCIGNSRSTRLSEGVAADAARPDVQGLKGPQRDGAEAPAFPSNRTAVIVLQTRPAAPRGRARGDPTVDSRREVALFVDLENIREGIRQAYEVELSPTLLIEKARKYG